MRIVCVFKNSFSIFPGNVEDFYKLRVYTEFINQAIDNEVAIFMYIKTFGILNFASLSFLIFKNCRKLIILFFLTSLHYSYLFSPLVYLVYFVYSDEGKKLDKYDWKTNNLLILFSEKNMIICSCKLSIIEHFCMCFFF